MKRCRELEGRAFNNWLGERRQAQEGQRHLDDVSRLTEAVHRQVPQLRYARAERRGVERRRTKLRNGKEMKTLRAHGFNQRPRFEQVVGYLERKSAASLTECFFTTHTLPSILAWQQDCPCQSWRGRRIAHWI